MVEGEVEAAAFLPQQRAIDDERGDGGEVAQFEEVGGELVAPVKFGDLALEIAQPGGGDRKSTRLNSSHHAISRMPSSA